MIDYIDWDCQDMSLASSLVPRSLPAAILQNGGGSGLGTRLTCTLLHMLLVYT